MNTLVQIEIQTTFVYIFCLCYVFCLTQFSLFPLHLQYVWNNFGFLFSSWAWWAIDEEKQKTKQKKIESLAE